MSDEFKDTKNVMPGFQLISQHNNDSAMMPPSKKEKKDGSSNVHVISRMEKEDSLDVESLDNKSLIENHDDVQQEEIVKPSAVLRMCQISVMVCIFSIPVLLSFVLVMTVILNRNTLH